MTDTTIITGVISALALILVARVKLSGDKETARSPDWQAYADRQASELEGLRGRCGRFGGRSAPSKTASTPWSASTGQHWPSSGTCWVRTPSTVKTPPPRSRRTCSIRCVG